MKIARVLALSAVAFIASISASWAGPCSGEIDAMVARINAALASRAGAGQTAKEQAVATGRHVQPTPRSMAAAEEKLGESRSRKSAQDDKWSFCLTAGTLCPTNQERQ